MSYMQYGLMLFGGDGSRSERDDHGNPRARNHYDRYLRRLQRHNRRGRGGRARKRR